MRTGATLIMKCGVDHLAPTLNGRRYWSSSGLERNRPSGISAGDSQLPEDAGISIFNLHGRRLIRVLLGWRQVLVGLRRGLVLVCLSWRLVPIHLCGRLVDACLRRELIDALLRWRLIDALLRGRLIVDLRRLRSVALGRHVARIWNWGSRDVEV
jgi:hypothetical protein